MAFGGFLVGELKFNVQEARVILKDLSPWLRQSGYLGRRINGGDGADDSAAGQEMIFLRPPSGNAAGFEYWLAPGGIGRGGGGLGNDLDEDSFFSDPRIRAISVGAFQKRFSEFTK